MAKEDRWRKSPPDSDRLRGLNSNDPAYTQYLSSLYWEKTLVSVKKLVRRS